MIKKKEQALDATLSDYLLRPQKYRYGLKDLKENIKILKRRSN